MQKNKEELFEVVAVKDELTNTFLQPTFGDSEEALKRIFRTQINTIPIWKENASDYSLYRLAWFDQETGELYPDIEKLASGHAVLNRKETE